MCLHPEPLSTLSGQSQCCGFSRVGSGRSTGILQIVSANILKSFLLALATHRPMGTPLASVRSERLVPLLLRSTGLGPVFFPRQGSLGHRAIHCQPTPVDAVERIILGQPGLPEAQKKAVLHPRLEAVVRRGAWTKAGHAECVPLATGSQHKEDAVRAGAIRHAGPPAAKAVGVEMRGQKWLHERPQLVADDELSAGSGDAFGSGARAGFRLRTFHPSTCHETSYSDRQ